MEDWDMKEEIWKKKSNLNFGNEPSIKLKASPIDIIKWKTENQGLKTDELEHLNDNKEKIF
jgi:hypothetical protein